MAKNEITPQFFGVFCCDGVKVLVMCGAGHGEIDCGGHDASPWTCNLERLRMLLCTCCPGRWLTTRSDDGCAVLCTIPVPIHLNEALQSFPLSRSWRRSVLFKTAGAEGTPDTLRCKCYCAVNVKVGWRSMPGVVLRTADNPIPASATGLQCRAFLHFMEP